MKVMEVEGPGGSSLPFLQWRYLPMDPNYDGQFLISLDGKVEPGQTVSLRVRSAGTLFEPIGTAHYIIDEDDWYPRMDGAQSAVYDVTITLPEDQIAVSAGKLVEDVKLEQEKKRRFRYRSTKPLTSASIHYGPFVTATGMADRTEVQIYGIKRSVQVRQNMDFIKAEIENMLEMFNRLYGPLEFPVLRVVGTPEAHGRGFEGLLLLSQRSGLEGTSSSADVFRAHEVAHQWWGNIVQTLNWPEDRWISESFAEY
jgi:aminopeptidase N